MSEDWGAVARAVNARMAELELSQRELIERSQVSKATVGELVRNSTQRRRSARTLEALSQALEWHPNHLHAVLTGRRIPNIGEPAARSDEDVLGRLAAIEYRLGQITEHLASIDELNIRLDELRDEIKHVIDVVSPDHQNRRA